MWVGGEFGRETVWLGGERGSLGGVVSVGIALHVRYWRWMRVRVKKGGIGGGV